jgi:hypothetical protein
MWLKRKERFSYYSSSFCLKRVDVSDAMSEA